MTPRLSAAAGRLGEALRQPAIPAHVSSIAGRLAALFQPAPDLATVATKESYQQLDEWISQVGQELTELVAAIRFPPELPVTGAPTAAERALLTEIIAHPADDAPRHRYAELAAPRNDPRAELIREQFIAIELQQKAPQAGELDKHQARADALIKFHPEWAEDVLRLGAKQVRFYRGFIGLIEIDVGDFLRQAEAIFQLAPVQHLQLRNAAGHLGELAASPYLRRIRSLLLNEQELADADVEALVDSPHLRELRLLDLQRNKLTNTAVTAIAASPNLGGLRFLNVDGNPCDNPCDGQTYLTDTQWVWTPRKFGLALEAKYGPKPYFHFPTQRTTPDVDQLWFVP